MFVLERQIKPARPVTATFAVRIDDEVYVYVRGRLVMKRWLRRDKPSASATFHVSPAWTVWNYEHFPGHELQERYEP